MKKTTLVATTLLFAIGVIGLLLMSDLVAPASAQGGGGSSNPKAAVLLHCQPGAYSGSQLGFVVFFADNSPAAPFVATGGSCAAALQSLAEANFVIKTSGITEGNNGFNFVLVKGTF